MRLYPDYLLVSSKRYRMETARKLWRVKHDLELPRGIWRVGMPSVHPLTPNHHSPFQKWAQLVSFGLNPWFANMRDRWRDMYDYRYAFANNQGYDIPNDPRADFVNMRDTDKELPRVEALVCGGSMIAGERVGDMVRVQGLHYNAPVSLEYLQAHPEFWVRGVYAGGTGQPFRMLGDKYSGPAFIHPLIVNRDKGDLMIEAYKLQEWRSATPPDPLKVYL
jgi:hypothetical protein